MRYAQSRPSKADHEANRPQQALWALPPPSAQPHQSHQEERIYEEAHRGRNYGARGGERYIAVEVTPRDEQRPAQHGRRPAPSAESSGLRL
jgi:hypothetical protein